VSFVFCNLQDKHLLQDLCLLFLGPFKRRMILVDIFREFYSKLVKITFVGRKRSYFKDSSSVFYDISEQESSSDLSTIIPT
jgi:hypothetical protein